MPTKNTTIDSDGNVRLEPSRVFFPVSVSDSADNITEGGVAYTCRGISFAAAGALKVTRPDGTAVVIPDGALAAGIIHPIQAVRIWENGTTATGIMAYL